MILTGFDGRKTKTLYQIAAEFGEYLTPKANGYVRIKDRDELIQIAPMKFQGRQYEFSYDTASLGNVEFDLFYGENSAEGPIVCGAINAILPLTELYSRMDKKQKGKVSKVWKTTSGHIYLEKGNTFRLHDGNFSEKFYDSDACDQLIELLLMVSEELEQLSESKRNEDQISKKQHLINRIVEIGRKLMPSLPFDEFSNAGNLPANGLIPPSEQEYYFVPNCVRMHPGEVEVVTLVNKGTKFVDFSNIIWETNDRVITILQANAAKVTIKATSTGTASLIAKGPFGTHTVAIEISNAVDQPYIAGPTYVKPGDSYTYEVKRYTDSATLLWEVECKEKGVIGVPEITDKKKYTVKVEQDCSDTVITIFVRSKSSKVLIARKVIYVTEAGARKQAPVIRIAKRDYMLTCGSMFKDTVAQVDYLFRESGIPEIMVNPIHQRIKDLGYMQSMDHILVAIANAAVMDQVSEGIIRVAEAQGIVENFIWVMKENLLKVGT